MDAHEASEGTDMLSSEPVKVKSRSSHSASTDSEGQDDDSDDSDDDAESINAAVIDFSLGFSERDLAVRLQRSRISSRLNIRFGNEDDPSAEASRVASRSDSPKIPVINSAAANTSQIAQRTMLYIQMEVGGTLKYAECISLTTILKVY